MIRNLVASALFAGFAAGLFAAALQFVFVQPVLLQGELYELGRLVHVGVASAGHDHSSHDHAAAQTAAGTAPEAAPPADLARSALTVLFTALIYCGYALVLVAGFALAEVRGERVSARAGLIWGLAGFIAVHFAPAAGLPPELPGMAAADLTARQIWWGATVVSTAAGLWLIGFGRSVPVWALAAVLIAVPHLIGAPQPEVMTGPVPPELAALFAGRTLAVGMAVWAVLGLLAGAIWDRMRA